MRSGKYVYKKEQAGVAHARSQYYAREACKEEENVIIDNTNVSWNEVKPYLLIAREFSYDVKIMEPDWTPELRVATGGWNTEFLRGRSSHDVPQDIIELMASKFDLELEDKVRRFMSGQEV
jgi:predicted kinase